MPRPRLRLLAILMATALIGLAWWAPSHADQDSSDPPQSEPLMEADRDWETTRGPERFPEVDWLIGEWQGYGVFKNKTTWLHKSWSYDVGGVFLHERTLDIFPPDSLSTEFEIHQDTVMWFRDTGTGALKSVTFFVEGFVTTATVTVEHGGRRYVVESTHVENAPPGMATRFTVERVGDDEIEETFELKFPEREWFEMERLTLRRVHRGGSR